jgi:hypothetical protein
MLRLLEVVLFLSPFLAFALWRLAAPATPPSPRLVAATASALLVIAIALYWFSREDVLPPDAAYAPAELRDGRLVPSHPVPR